jgi:hypothetical protein
MQVAHPRAVVHTISLILAVVLVVLFVLVVVLFRVFLLVLLLSVTATTLDLRLNNLSLFGGPCLSGG